MEPTFYPNKPTVGYLLDLKQGTPEWIEFRKDKITATGAYKILQGESIKDILAEKENTKDFFGNEYTERGHLLEDEARRLYEDLNSVDVVEVGAVINTKYPIYACSPDGLLLNENGGIEIKAFQEERQENVFKNLDPAIIAQIQFNLFITESEWWDWILFNPEVEDISKAYHCKRFYPDEEMFEKFRNALNSQNDDTEIQETALTILQLQSELQKVPEEIKAQIEDFQAKQAQIDELKQRLKEQTTGKIKKIVKLGEDTLDLSIYDSNRVSVEDPQLVPKEYTTQIKVDGVYLGPDGEFYKDEPNTKLVGNLYKTGKPLPKGFTVKTSRSISIKYNGKTL